MKRLFLILLASFPTCLTVSGDTLPTGAAQSSPSAAPAQASMLPPNIRIELQVVAVPEKIGIPLAAELKRKEKIESGNATIQQLLAKGIAKLVGWPILTTRSGQRSVIEAVKEIRYPTEFHPPTVSLSPNVPVDSNVKLAPTVDVTTFEGIPAAFETRTVGVTLEVEVVLNPDGKTVDLNIVTQHVRLKGYHKITLESAARKGKVEVEQPEFDSNKVNTSLTMQSGQRMLMGVYPTEDPPKHLEFFILKVELVPVE